MKKNKILGGISIVAGVALSYGMAHMLNEHMCDWWTAPTGMWMIVGVFVLIIFGINTWIRKN